eukprot:507157-Karenia_brevis.AAC.1
MIVELRNQNAAQSAFNARLQEVEKHGRLLQNLRIPSKAMVSHFSIGDVFTKYVGTATELDIREPYLVSDWQFSNLEALLASLLTRTHVRE